MNDLIGGNLAAGGSGSQVTCGLGTGFTGNNDDWFEVTTAQAGYLNVALESIPFACDWDLYVYDTSLNFKFSSSTTNVCRDNSCAISAPTWNGETCTVRKTCSTGVVSSANGKWDDSGAIRDFKNQNL